MDLDRDDTINVGSYIIVQRQKYTKLHKFGSLTSCTTLGKDQIELAAIEKCRYSTTFRMMPTCSQRKYSLEAVEADDPVEKADVSVDKSGEDNRHILDDGKSQKLTAEQIAELRDASKSSKDILETLISNSNTFHSKTEYSQQKYVKKKQKKYFEYITVKRPTLRSIAEIMYRQDPGKVLGVRPDTLSQLLAYANLTQGGHCILYDSGSNGLLAAAVLNSIGPGTTARLIHMHPGNSPQKQGLLAMNFPSEQLNRCISVNVYSVLRHFYQQKLDDDQISNQLVGKKRKLLHSEDTLENCNKKLALDTNQSEDSKNLNPNPIWMQENEKAHQILEEKVDSLIIASKEHPLAIFKGISSFVKLSRPFVIFNQYQEPIQDCYISMRKMQNVTCLKMMSSWLREYQVLENRTHPDVLMQGSSGYLLTGYIVQN